MKHKSFKCQRTKTVSYVAGATLIALGHRTQFPQQPYTVVSIISSVFREGETEVKRDLIILPRVLLAGYHRISPQAPCRA